MNPKRKGFLVTLGLSGALVFLAASASAQTTLYSTLGRNTGYDVFGTSSLFEAAWNQTGTYSNVSIAAKIDGGGGTASGTAWLMTRIGPGTTVIDEIAHVNFSVTGPVFSPDLTTLFTGLTLGPGTYHLVIYGSGFDGGWEITRSILPITAPGVSAVDRERHGVNSPFPAYLPAAVFDTERPSDFTDEYFQFEVSVIPEPGAVTLFVLGAALAGFRRGKMVRIVKFFGS